MTVGQPVEMSNKQCRLGAGLNERSRMQTQIWASVATKVIIEARSIGDGGPERQRRMQDFGLGSEFKKGSKRGR